MGERIFALCLAQGIGLSKLRWHALLISTFELETGESDKVHKIDEVVAKILVDVHTGYCRDLKVVSHARYVTFQMD